MDLFTYLLAKNGHNTSIQEDLFSYLLGLSQGGGGEIKTATGITINIPDAKKLVNFMMTKESTQDGTPTPESPVEVKTITGSVDVKVVGKNLFNKNDIISGKYIGSIGGIGNDNTAFISNYIKIELNTNYYINGRTEWRSYALYDENKNFLSWESTSSYNGIINISNSQCKYLRFNGELSNLNTIQFEEGSTATEYEAYKETTTTIPLNNNEIVGIGDYKDELLVDKNGHVFINKKTGKKVLNGSESWATSTNADNYYSARLEIDEMQKTNSYTNEILSNMFSAISFTNASNAIAEGIARYNGSSTANNRIYLSIAKNRLTYVSSWVNALKKWLESNNVTTYYPLETPQLIDLQTTVDLKLFKGVNNISNSVDGYMTIEYH